MSRHRDVRNLDYDQEYDEAYDDAVYGHSVDEHDYGVSPSTEQYLYSQRKDSNCGFGAYFPGTENIKEEEESLEEGNGFFARRDSTGYERPRLSSEDEVRLNSVLDEIRNVVGDQFSDAEMITSVLDNNYDFEASLNTILDKRSNLGPPTAGRPSAQGATATPATSSSSSSRRQPPPSTRTKNNFASRGNQPGGSFVFGPFGLMLPLSYSFSSAFTFERGKMERIPVRQMVKEWHTAVLRTRTKSDKLKEKELGLAHFKEPVPDSPKSSSLTETDDSKEDSEILSVEIGNLSVHSDGGPSTSEDSLATSSGVSDREQTCSEEGEGCVPVANAKWPNESGSMPGGTGHGKVIPPLCMNKGLEIPPLNSMISSHTNNKESKFIPPLLNFSKKENCEAKDFKFNLSGFPISRDPQMNLELPERKAVPSIPPLLGTQDTKTSRLASLASAHFKQVGSSMPVSIGKPFSSSSPPTLSLSQSPLDQQSNLGALASAHFGLTANKIGAIPSLSSLSSGSRDGGKIPNFKGYVHEGKTDEVLSNAASKRIPLKSNRGIPELFTNSFSPPGSDVSFEESRSTETENVDPFPLSEDSTEMEVDELNPGPEVELDLAIDLKLALTKNKPTETKESSNDDSRLKAASFSSLIKACIERIPNLKKKERSYMAREPSSVFGKTLLRFKRNPDRSRKVYHKIVSVPYKPFDFASRSPDDIVKAALADTTNVDLYKLRKREKRTV